MVSLSLNPSSKLKAQPELQAKEAINFMKFLCCCCLVSNHKSTTSRQPRRVKFDLQAYFNPTKRNLKKKIGVTWPPSLPRLKKGLWLYKSTTSMQHRRVKFNMKAYFNPTKRNLKKKMWSPDQAYMFPRTTSRLLLAMWCAFAAEYSTKVDQYASTLWHFSDIFQSEQNWATYSVFVEIFFARIMLGMTKIA